MLCVDLIMVVYVTGALQAGEREDPVGVGIHRPQI